MKKFFALLIVSISVAGISCKKDKHQDNTITIPPKQKQWIVTTIAGDGTNDFLDGAAMSAKFKVPYDVAVDANGIIYVADAGNHRIRKIEAGQVSTFAGNGVNGIVDANGSLAQFRDPYHMTLDAHGNIYSLDVSDWRIRKTSATADVTIYAGKATAGYEDGPATTASFRASEGGIVADAEGNIYITDFVNQRIRKIDIYGDVTTIAGNGIFGFKDGDSQTAEFNFPTGIAIDKQGNLYVADGLNLRIRKITPDGQVSTFAGSGFAGNADGAAASALFNSINDIVIDANGNLYVTDNDRIRQISPEGTVTTIAGSFEGYADGVGTSTKFNNPSGLGIDKNNNIYVADAGNHRIRKLSFQ